MLEALSALADGRVERTPDGAMVRSSSGAKVYRVRFDSERNTITSNDNGSFYVGYLGYPAIAYLMQAGRLTYSKRLATLLARIHWKQLNTELKSDYVEVERRIVSELAPADRAELSEFAGDCLGELKGLQLGQLASDERPPAGW